MYRCLVSGSQRELTKGGKGYIRVWCIFMNFSSCQLDKILVSFHAMLLKYNFNRMSVS